MVNFLGVGILVLMLTLPSVSVAESETYRTKIAKLATLEHFSEVIDDYRTTCLDKMKEYDPEKLVIAQPDMFSGVRPGSKYWPEIVVAFRNYVNKSCNYISEKEYLEEFIKVYTSLLDEKTLDAILRFYDTYEGKAYLKATRNGTQKLQEYLLSKNAETMKAAMEIYGAKIIESGRLSRQ